MFAPPVAKPKAKTTASSNNESALRRATPLGHRYGTGGVEHLLMLQRSIGNQAVLQLLRQRGLLKDEHDNPEQDAGSESISARGEPPRGAWDFSKLPLFPPGRMGGYQPPSARLPGPIQAKLEVGTGNDPLEHAADCVADQVMRMSAPEGSVVAPPQLSRKCADCAVEEKLRQTEQQDHEHEHLQNKFAQSSETRQIAIPSIVREMLRSSGQPLDPSARDFMEQRFGHDFGRIRIHTDPPAARAAAALGAEAFTVGHHIAFARGRFLPGLEHGKRLVAHELTHAIQQAATSPRIALSPEKERPAPSRFSPGGFTDKEVDALSREAEDRIKLGSMALTLAERQARRREFWDGNPSYNSADVKEAFDLDLYWDPKEEGFIRQPYVDEMEAMVYADPEARRLYDNRLWDLTENKPAKKSRFSRAVSFVCEHVESCSSNLEQFRRDRDSGMSRDEALNRGMARLVVAAELMALPGSGPSGPIPVGPGGRPTGMPLNVPATEGAGLGGAERPAAPTSKPLLTTGPKSGGPPQGNVAPPAEPAVPEPITNEPATNPIPRGRAEVGEPVGDYRIYGEKGLKGKTFEREIWGLKSNQKPTTEIGVGPLLKLFKSLMAEARAAGATELRIVGRVVRNENILKMKGLVEKYGGTFRQVDAMTVKIEIPLSQ